MKTKQALALERDARTLTLIGTYPHIARRGPTRKQTCPTCCYSPREDAEGFIAQALSEGAAGGRPALIRLLSHGHCDS